MSSLFDSIVFLGVSGTLLFLPGYVLLRVFSRSGTLFSSLETLLFSFALSIGLLDFVMIFLGKLGIPYTRFSLISVIAVAITAISAVTWLIRRIRHEETGSETSSIPLFSRRQGWLFITLIALTFLIKTIYLTNAVLPTSTDLGHHMYWAKLIADTGSFPEYAKQEIETREDGVYVITEPQPIADFIIGEHLPFAAVEIFSRVGFFSAFPVVLLFLINMLGLLALAALGLRLAQGIRFPMHASFLSPANVALVILLLFGPLYSLASPQAKFVSGGVVGNMIGNLFIPLILLTFYRAFREKNGGLLALSFFLTFTLAYTHHLSTLMLLYVLIGSALLYLVINHDTLFATLKAWYRLLLSPVALLVALGCIVFFFTIAMPTYVETNAVGTAIGTPTKTTRTGLSFSQVTFSSGEARVAFGIVGLFLLLMLGAAKRYAGVFVAGWGIMLLLMTMRPHWLLLDIPSNRIGAYLSFPLGVLAALALVALFASIRNRKTWIPQTLLLLVGFSVFAFAIGSGSYDNSQTLLPESKSLAALQTFSASAYLAEKTTRDEIILKDHNYISADAWMKLFFLRDYAYPLSRGFFKRYEDNPDREQCTLLMISVPNTPRGEKCYAETGTDYVVVNPHYDTTQFEKSGSFSRVYSSDMVDIYKRMPKLKEQMSNR